MIEKAKNLRVELEKSYDSFTLDISRDGVVFLTIIHSTFENLDRAKRVEIVEKLIAEAGLKSGILELYTPEEAETLGVEIPKIANRSPMTWEDAISAQRSGESPIPKKRNMRSYQRVVFYSYKGGVGRTTALIHTAFQLVRAGKRVCVVDLDLEAPGIQFFVAPPDSNHSPGIVDYLWEKQTRPDSNTWQIELIAQNEGQRTGVLYSVEDPISRNSLFVVPAGTLNFDYMERLATLNVPWKREEVSPWDIFEKELVGKISPDFILIDSRTGINTWGGLSLLSLADASFLVLYPSIQNVEGMKLVCGLLDKSGDAAPHLVLSPVPDSALGKQLAEQISEKIQFPGYDKESNFIIFHNTGIAFADKYPVESAMADYAPLANILLEVDGRKLIEEVIHRSDRSAIISAFVFPNRDGNSADEIDKIFQKTSDFDRFLDDPNWVVRGRKGTGKSTLYRLFCKHKERADYLAAGKLANVTVVSGHGPAIQFRPTSDVFGAINEAIVRADKDWLSVWRAYATIQIYVAGKLERSNVSKLLWDHLRTYFSNVNSGDQLWESKHTEALLQIINDLNLNGLCRDAISSLNKHLTDRNEKIWLIYDDLDQDIKERSSWQQDAIGGLLRFAYDLNNLNLHKIRMKILLREDIWKSLVFTNKSHFGEERTLLLQWKIEDFLRLAWRLTTYSAPFNTISQQTEPMNEKSLESADEEKLRRALAPLWGMHTERGKNQYAARWVYSRLTDTEDNTYPRSLTILLIEARKSELAQLHKKNNKNPADRLLRGSALQAGLIEASKERCDALRNEYQDLVPFFDQMKDLLSSFFNEDALLRIWKRTMESEWPSFEVFTKHLQSIGLIGRRRSARVKHDFFVADLYIDGFSIPRAKGSRR